MVDELTQESFQTGKAIVTVSVDLITAIAEACKRSEEKNPGMSAEQKETLLGKVVDKVVSNYKETHGSLKDFNQEGKDVTSIDVNDERTAEILKKACKKSHIPVDMREVTRADGSVTHTAFCEVKSIDQVASLLKMASEQVLEEQKEMTKTLVLYDEHDQAIMSADFVNNGEINMDEVEKMADNEQIYYIIDAINDAINAGKQISFQYYDYTGLKKKVLKNKGEVYKLSPYKLLWCGDYYYVLGYSEKKSKVINFRVDRIASKPEILDKYIIPMPDDFDIENYTKEVFFMFSGEKVLVDLRCDNSLMKTMVDRFGEDVTTLAYDMTSFRVQTEVSASPTFFGWVFGFNGKVQILAPESVKEQYRQMITKADENMPVSYTHLTLPTKLEV